MLHYYIRRLISFFIRIVFTTSNKNSIRCDHPAHNTLTEEEQLFASDIGVRIVQDIIIGSISGYVIFAISDLTGRKLITANPLMTVQDAARASMYTKFADKETLNAMMNDFKNANEEDEDDDLEQWWKKHSGDT